MNKSWKNFIIIIASLVCTIIVCLTINISINRITKNISAGDVPVQGQPLVDNNQTDVVTGDPLQTGVAVTDAAGNSVTNASGVVITQNNTQQTGGSNAVQSSTQAGSNPLSYSKSQIVSYYNSCLNKSYSQPKMTDVKSEKVSVSFDDRGVLINGKTSALTTKVADIIIKANAKETTHKAVTFTNGKSSEGSATQYILPVGLTSSGARSATISKNGSGYRIVITLVQESCDFKTKPPYNKSCTWPLDFADIDFKGYAEITSAKFNYPGTVLTADIDSQGRVCYVQTNMPLSVSNASGTMLKLAEGTTITVSSVSGTWFCKNTLTF